MALRRMNLRDFVIVHELELDLLSGFTVLTGETGAGKSILIDALQLALGARADVVWCARVRHVPKSALSLIRLTGWLLGCRMRVFYEADTC